MNKNRLFEAVDIPEDVKQILLGAYCYGDDGEPASVSNVYMDNGYPVVDIQQEDGVVYYGLELNTFLDSIELEDEDYDIVDQYLADLCDEEVVTESFEPIKSKSKSTNIKRKLILEEDAIGSGKFNTRKDWHHKRQ